MTNVCVINENNVEDILKKIEETYWDIPFGNTDFQCENFVIAASITPERAFRTIGLQMHHILTNLRQVKYEETLQNIEIEQLKEQIENEETNKYERKKAEAKLQLILANKNWSKKIVLDSIKQLEVYYKHFEALPKYTREQFEKAEQIYFEQSQRRIMLGIVGAKESIMNMVDDKKTIENIENMWNCLPAEKRQEMLEQISRESIASMIEFNQKQNTN